MSIKETLIEDLKTKRARIGILGLGYVGLPLAVVFAEAGFHVTGIDTDTRKVDCLNKGVSYIPDVKTEAVEKLVQSGLLTATTDFSALQGLDAVSICVPTPLRQTGDPDMSFIISATDELSKYIHKGMVVVLQSTTYPGTTRELLLPKLGTEHGLTVGEDWFLAFSPERVDPGREDFTTKNTPKVMGGITEACGEVATIWYEGAIDIVHRVSSAEAAVAGARSSCHSGRSSSAGATGANARSSRRFLRRRPRPRASPSPRAEPRSGRVSCSSRTTGPS